MKRILSGFLKLQQKNYLSHLPKRYIHKIDFEGNDEILENYLGNIKLIGINLPDNKNILTESAVDKLCSSLKDFYSNDEILVAILHGLGGNFCSGVVQTEKALEKCQEIIKVLHQGNKPIIIFLKGRTVDFGFQLATFCDLKVMEENSLVSFGHKNGKIKIPDLVYERLISTVGVVPAGLLILTNSSWSTLEASQHGFINFISTYGCGLGTAIVWAQSIALSPLSEVLEKKALLNSYINKFRQTV